MQLLIQQYEHFHFKQSKTLSDTYIRFQKLLNALKLYGRVYSTKDTNLKFLRSLPKEWKHLIVSLRHSHEFKDYNLEKLYGVRSVVFVEGGLNTNCTILSKFVWLVLLFKYETNLRRKYKRNNI